MDKDVRKSHYVAVVGGGGGGGGTLSLSVPSASPLYVYLELVGGSAGLSRPSRQASGMQVRPLKPV